jgi:hypothetical protein
MNSKEEIFQLEIKSKKFHDDIREKVFISKEVYKTQKLPITLLCYKYFFKIGV